MSDYTRANSSPANDWLLRVVGFLAAAVLARGAFGPMIGSGVYSAPFSPLLRTIFCAAAALAAVAFVFRGYLAGALVGGGASALSAVLLVATWRAFVQTGAARPASHFGWGFALTVPAGLGFLFVFIRSLSIVDLPDAAPVRQLSNDR